jgi:hypothetical protein
VAFLNLATPMLPACASTFNLYNPARSRLYLPAIEPDTPSSDTISTMSGLLVVLLSAHCIFSSQVGRRIGLSQSIPMRINPVRYLTSTQCFCISNMHSLSFSVPIIHGLSFSDRLKNIPGMSMIWLSLWSKPPQDIRKTVLSWNLRDLG